MVNFYDLWSNSEMQLGNGERISAVEIHARPLREEFNVTAASLPLNLIHLGRVASVSRTQEEKRSLNPPVYTYDATYSKEIKSRKLKDRLTDIGSAKQDAECTSKHEYEVLQREKYACKQISTEKVRT